MIKEITAKYNAEQIEKKVTQLWEDSEAYQKTREHRKTGKKLFFVDGPPYTTGHIHLGTAWNKIIKDSILRYYSMNNYNILERPGWDMHGLPIEVKVEGVLGFKSKKDIESFGVENFIEKCKEFALTQKQAMTEQFQRLGVWMNWEDPYMTLKDNYIEAAWWTLKQASEKDLLEVGKRSVNWCPRCETAIADSEVEYSERTDPSIYVKFKVKGEENTFIVIWTTTPWTIPANVAVAVHPDFEYSKFRAIKQDGSEEILITATDLIKNVLKQGRYVDYEVLETMRGDELTKLEYESPIGDLVPIQNEIRHGVYLADFVAVENTGCVHIAPGHGMDDFNLGVKYNLPILCPVGPNGSYTEEAGEYAGKNVREANPIVIEDLRERNRLLAEGTITHRYGHCWRCKTPIIYLATEQWFLKVTEIKDKMLEEIDAVDWYPDWAGSARFRTWVEGARDWCISRQRYWGIPIPVWKCKKCGKLEVIGTKAELLEKSGTAGDIELHRPYVDKITIPCECGGEKKRVEDVFDVWFDSAVASWATLQFPQTREQFDEWWPADFITEGHDQTRGWFYSQLGASMVSFGRAPYKSVLMHGFTLDAGGKKMSKSLGNVVSPIDIVDRFGADTLRAYVLSSSAPWDDLKFNLEEVENIHRSINILWNVFRFPLPYMALDNFDPLKISLDSVKDALREEDRWILSRVQSVIKTVDEAMSGYQLHKAVREIMEFILEDLSRWYIQLIRPRTWTEAEDPDKLAAYCVLYEVYVTLTKLISPFMPYLAEEMYQNLIRNADPNALESVHMCDWPTVNEAYLDPELESAMDTVRSIVEAASNARQKAGRKLRWPVSRIIVSPKNEDVAKAVENLRSVLMDQTNSKSIVLTPVGKSWDELGLEVIPDPGKIGPVFKKDAGKVISVLQKVDGFALKKAFSEAGEFELSLADGTRVTVTSNMANFKETLPEGTASAESDAGIVYVDANLNPELEAEGYAREVIRRLQDMRKELDLVVDENIRALVRIEDERVLKLVETLKDLIAEEVRADIFELGSDINVTGALVKDWDVEGIAMKMGIAKK
ncbi:Isoleucyl-tRNA synthetase [Methanosarcina thermophila]|jgi:isoleucyl-tRNA synthetase|uniref:Isoleucine--tRNA ligase n=3 Tax=Methanosarcina thermophila TaxID=2210 RepID=A0A1I7ALQ8_METTE|nr:isoleucine--tRNA ligase [Methanosarcina thermophila]AKB12510.1 Isoleucyl-tRNA synthetase [Methanosarcina thermophila TM-1]AKB16836.1 Isoleucyl-tRNA synthetase [Methanosarcina thermophila CHTI-55]NLU56300.1 isoleucine--tRNA ligase [Methanosarcina thermophila]SFT75867.1 Isoleucyl-tRNA synthetase [Methanosarcina thermophila]BAW30219.1 isoleucyl-tRNA synthetase [Methanosarcina thermophila]